ncbi:MAG: DUF2723 domain-containing protein [Bacteroidales bacterium]|jgi:tetratricopeptide (TPR) repeat protein|nr:DUF2723 domain-containing protein [Bacteroidales bacterium]
MKNYKFWNNTLGWLVFLIATITYFCTIEPTASWWDCGEYISTAYKLQVGHPPGAPTFQLIGRFFSLFAFGNVQNVAMMVNVMSALCSSFTILFLFWSITMLARKVVAPKSELNFNVKENINKSFIIFGAGIIGALAYTFSDTFWFSAVEGEVYAMSSLCTAIVFWAILKWEEQSDEVDAAKWLIFIAYIIGLSIGVHLLNLLAIVAIALVIYYKKYKPSIKGFIITILTSFLIIGGILYILVPMVVKLAGWFELFFVNTLGTPFNVGTIVYFALLIALLVFFWRWSVKKGKLIWNTIAISLVYILIGYSTFFILVIRANTNTPINEGSPSDAISMLSYLNREQYGETPLLYGPYYYGPYSYTPYDIDTQKRDFVRKKGPVIYVKDKTAGKYIITDDGLPGIPQYEKNFMTVFPRMWNGSKQHYVDAYKAWGGVDEKPNMRTQYSGEAVRKPTFSENLRYFFSYQINHMYTRYFMWNFVGRQNDIEGHGGYSDGNWKSGINFIDGVRLGDQKDLPDTLKNNPANNSFYFLPLILGLIGLFYHFKKSPQGGSIVMAIFIMTGLAIIVYLNQQPYQPRERDYAYAGSFYAFSIWIGFGLIQVVNWLKKLLKKEKAAIACSFVICMIVPIIMAAQGWDDHNRSKKYAARDFAENYLRGCLPNSVVISNGDNDTFPLWYVQEVEGFRTDIRVMNYMLSASDWYAHQMMRKVYDSERIPLTLHEKDYYKGVNDVIYFNDRNLSQPLDVKEFIKFLGEGKLQMKTQNGKTANYVPTKTFKLKVNKEKVLANGIVPPELADKIVDEIVWTINQGYLGKNDILFFDFLASFDWDRPLYFTNPNIVKDVFNVDKYCYLDGIVYKFVPVASEDYVRNLGGINIADSYDILVNQCVWGNLNDPRVTPDRESIRNTSIMRQNYYRVADALVKAGRLDSAEIVIDKAIEFFPNSQIQFEHATVGFAEVYLRCGEIEKAQEVIRIIHDKYYNETIYYIGLKTKFFDYYESEIQYNVSALYRLYSLCNEYRMTDMASQYKEELTPLIKMLYNSEL